MDFHVLTPLPTSRDRLTSPKTGEAGTCGSLNPPAGQVQTPPTSPEIGEAKHGSLGPGKDTIRLTRINRLKCRFLIGEITHYG